MEIEVVDTAELYKQDRERYRESNDCVVRVMATAFKIPYERAMRYCATFLGRKHRQGSPFIACMTREQPASERVERVDMWQTIRLSFPEGQEPIDQRNHPQACRHGLHARKFIRMHPKGLYICVNRNHAFVIRDGVVYGNYNDANLYVRLSYKIRPKDQNPAK